MKRRVLVLLAVVIAVAAIAMYRTYARTEEPREFSGVVESREVQIGSKVGGRVIAVQITEGQDVRAGQPLVRFEANELTAQRDQLMARVAQAKAEVAEFASGYRREEIEQIEAAARAQQAVADEARNGPRSQDVEQARAEAEAAIAEATLAATEFGRVDALHKSGDMPERRLDEARTRRDTTAKRAEAARQRLILLEAGTRPEQVRAAEARARQAQANLDLARSGYRSEDIAAARARLAEAEARLAELEARIADAELGAPALSRVETIAVRPGDLVQPGRIVLTLIEVSQVWVKMYVPEIELGRVRVGQRVAIQIDTFRGRDFAGEVQSVASQAEFLPRNVQTRSDREHQMFGVRVKIGNPAGELKPGMAATIRLP